MESVSQYYHGFNLIPGVGPLCFKKLLSYFPDLEQAWFAPLLELKRAGLEEKEARQIISARSGINPAEALQKVRQQGIKIITIQNKKYPKSLKEIYDPPALLYLKGEIKKPGNIYLSVVGTRKPTSYGRQVTFQIVGLLSQIKISIVSGLALGIDALAHQACLSFAGHTIAVLGSGIDDQSIYPRTNFKLAQRILGHGGALISEYPPGAPARKQNFPQRNRIIAGLSRGLLVIEAAERSGTSITARAALDQNRDIFAIPGSIYNPYSRGTNNLIKMGAKLVSDTQDILDELNLNLSLKTSKTIQKPSATQEEAIILKYLSQEPTHINEVIRKGKFSSGQVSTILTLLEMKGMVRNVGSGNYIINQLTNL